MGGSSCWFRWRASLTGSTDNWQWQVHHSQHKLRWARSRSLSKLRCLTLALVVVMVAQADFRQVKQARGGAGASNCLSSLVISLGVRVPPLRMAKVSVGQALRFTGFKRCYPTVRMNVYGLFFCWVGAGSDDVLRYWTVRASAAKAACLNSLFRTFHQ